MATISLRACSPSSSLVVIYGEPSSGKTFWTLDISLHIAARRSWNGREVEGGPVVYLALEGGSGIRNRVAAACKRMDLPDDTQFVLIQCPIDLRTPDADTPKLIASVKEIERIYRRPVRMVVIDTLFRAMAGGNENGAEDMGALVRNSDLIRQDTGACVLYIHHCGKEVARGMRGHSSLKAATDTEIEVTRGLDGTSVARVTRQRDLETEGSFAFRLEKVVLGANRRGKPVHSCVVEPADTPAATARMHEPKLSDTAVIAFRALCDLLASTRANLLPPQFGQPIGTRGVTRAHWCAEFYTRAGGDPVPDGPPKERERQRHALESQFARAATRLVAVGKVGIQDGWAWLPGTQPQ